MTTCKRKCTLINSSDKQSYEDLINPIVTKEELDQFKKIARDDYRVELTDEQAYEQASALVTFFEAILHELIDQKRRSVNNE